MTALRARSAEALGAGMRRMTKMLRLLPDWPVVWPSPTMYSIMLSNCGRRRVFQLRGGEAAVDQFAQIAETQIGAEDEGPVDGRIHTAREVRVVTECEAVVGESRDR